MNLNAERGRATLSYGGRPGPVGPQGPVGPAGSGGYQGGWMTAEVNAADLPAGITVGIIPAGGLIDMVVMDTTVQFTSNFFLRVDGTDTCTIRGVVGRDIRNVFVPSSGVVSLGANPAPISGVGKIIITYRV